MPLVRIIASTNYSAATPAKEAFVNTFYFNVSGSVDPPDYNQLLTDFVALQQTQSYNAGRFYDYRAYNMDEPTPREQKGRKTGTFTGTATEGVAQVALCLSYYADRNLPRQRGRVYLGPWTTSTLMPSSGQITTALNLAGKLAGLGGLNVDWSLWSPTTQTHTRINHAWVDNSWDIIRARKFPASSRQTWTGNG